MYSIRENGKQVLDKDILDAINECNFFIDDLFGTISDPQWGVAHRICHLSVECNFANQIIEYINSLEFDNNQSAKDRYTYLLNDKLRSDQ